MAITAQRKAQLDALIAQHKTSQVPASQAGSAGLSPERKAQLDQIINQFKSPQPEEPEKQGGFIQSLAHPFIKEIAAVPALLEGTVKLLKGDTKGAHEALTRERDFGPFGNTRPVGIDQETGQAENFGQFAKDIGGTGAEIGSYLVGGEGAAGVAKAGLKDLLKQGIKTGAKAGLASGVLGAGGSELQRSDATAGSVVSQSLLGGALGAATGGALGAGSTLVNSAVRRTFPKIASELQRSSLRLTPVQKRDLGAKIEDAVGFLNENKIVGTPKVRLDKVTTMYENTEARLQNFLKNEAQGVTADKQKIIDEITSIPEKYKFDRDYLAVKKQVESALETIKSQFPDQVPVDNLNEFKRSTFHGAYNKAGDKVLDTVEHDIGDVVYKNLSEALEQEGKTIDGQTLNEFNKQYQSIINARKLLKTAASRKQVGFIPKLISSLIAVGTGNVIGGPFGGAVAGSVAPSLVEGLSGSYARSATAKGLNALSKLPLPKVGRAVPATLTNLVKRNN